MFRACNPLGRSLIVTACLAVAATVSAQNFSYQGRLSQNGQPANGAYAIRFRMMDAAIDGNQIGPVLVAPSMPVENGLFSTALNFGPTVFAATGGRWLEVAIAPAGSIDYQPLSPRQRIDASPRALTLEWPAAGSAASAQPMLGLTNASTGTVVEATNSGTGVAVRATASNSASSANALVAVNNGTGRALLAQANGGGSVAEFRNVNSANTQTALKVSTNGDATAAEFHVTDLDGDKPAVTVTHDGAGPALRCESSVPEAAAIEIKGPIKLVGNGSFLRVYANDTYWIELDHPLLNGNPYAVLFIQDRANQYGLSPLLYPSYNQQSGRWWLRQRNQPVLFWGNTYDVLIFDWSSD